MLHEVGERPALKSPKAERGGAGETLLSLLARNAANAPKRIAMRERELGVLEIDFRLHLVALGAHFLFLELQQVMRGREPDAESDLLIVERLASIEGRRRGRGCALLVRV